MKKLIIILLGYLLLTSCKEKKTEFIQSKVNLKLFLLKNPPKDDSLTKKMIKDSLTKRIIKDFLLKNPKIRRHSSFLFYKYTYNTKYFIDHKEDDPSGLSLGEEQLSFYDNDRIAVFIISKCKNDSTKLVGELRFDNNYGNFYRPDTLIYKCN